MTTTLLAVFFAVVSILFMVVAYRTTKKYYSTDELGYFDDPAVWFFAGFVTLALSGILLI